MSKLLNDLNVLCIFQKLLHSESGLIWKYSLIAKFNSFDASLPSDKFNGDMFFFLLLSFIVYLLVIICCIDPILSATTTCKGKYIFFCPNDTIVASDSVECGDYSC